MGLKWTFRRFAGVWVEWICLAEDGDHWRDLVNVVVNHQVVAPWS
jgi:hypothetical protein